MVVNDSAFGKMNYDSGWEKTEVFSLYGRKYLVRVVAGAYAGQNILEKQREAYHIYQKKINECVKKIPNVLLKYYLDNYEIIEETMNIPKKIDRQHINEKNIIRLFEVKTVYFDRAGKFGWLCECAWDQENGIAIILSEQEPIVVEQEELI